MEVYQPSEEQIGAHTEKENPEACVPSPLLGEEKTTVIGEEGQERKEDVLVGLHYPVTEHKTFLCSVTSDGTGIFFGRPRGLGGTQGGGATL